MYFAHGRKMRIGKVYSEEFKKRIAKEYFNDRKASYIAKKYELSRGIQHV
ncbi:hypothetical protein [Williamsoniiplasma luminosum]|nr:hypothetical protein [Williamsoniiplasma luminosum]